MATVYSLRIAAFGTLTPATGKVGPTVPAGLVYIVRDIDAVDTTIATGDELAVYGPIGEYLLIARQGHELTGFNYSWRGRQVYGPGEQIAFQSIAGSWDIACSGYQLTLP